MPLEVIVIGAGIAGLTASAALRRSGHTVQIFEKSAFAAETGAALLLAPNGSRVLTSLGFSFKNARARLMSLWETRDGVTMERLSCVDFKNAKETYGAPVWAIHRVDLHRELMRLALEGEGGAKLHLASQVDKVCRDSGTVHLRDGSTHRADLIVAADGLHSIMRGLATEKLSKPAHSGSSAFRFLLSDDVLRQHPGLKETVSQKAPGASIFVDTADTTNERHMVWYDCQDGHVHNFVGIHPTRSLSDERSGDEKDSMLEEFANFHPSLTKVIGLAEDIKLWPLFVHDPLPGWIFGRVVLIGDAAHPMLPFGGQGSNQAIEDGGALGCILRKDSTPSNLAERLQIFQHIRHDRASRVQILSKVRVGREKEVGEELRAYAQDLEKIPTSFSERILHDYSSDVLTKCSEALSVGQVEGKVSTKTIQVSSSALMAVLGYILRFKDTFYRFIRRFL